MSSYQCEACGFITKNALKFCPKCRGTKWCTNVTTSANSALANAIISPQTLIAQHTKAAAQPIVAPAKPKGQLAILKPSVVVGLIAALILCTAAIIKSTESVASLLANKTPLDTELLIAQGTYESIRQDSKLLANDHPDTQFVQAIGQRLVAALPANSRYKQNYTFFVFKDDDVNAFAAPAGLIVVHTGLLDLMKRNSDLLAAVLAHEIMHVELRHGLKSIYQDTAMLAAIAWTFGVASDFGAMPASALINTRYSRLRETEADALGSQLLADAGWPKTAMPAMLRQLALVKSGIRVPQWFSSHPDSEKRAIELEGRK
ncbi:MAG: M48 family metallopeptidase [Brachymonas sp.]|nr:M48 family metallopeptidase [Brachymonas sp.]